MRLLLFILLFFALCATRNASAQTGEIFGTIVDEKHEPVMTANITLATDSGSHHSVITDFDGKYSIKSLSLERTFSLTVTHPSYKTDLLENIRLEAVNTLLKLNFRLEPKPQGDKSSCINFVPYWGPWRKPFIELRNPGIRTIITAVDLEHMPY